MLDEAADREAIERDRRRPRAPIGGFDVGRVGEHLERQTGGLGVLACEHHGTRAGVEHHGDVCAVDLRGHVEIAVHRAGDFDCCARGEMTWPGTSSAMTRSATSCSSYR